MGRTFLFLAIVAAGLLLWRSGRLDFVVRNTQTPLERKAKTALAEAGWEKATVEEREKDILVQVPLGRDSEKYRAAEEGRRACTRVAEALGGQHDVTVIVHGAPTESGYAAVYGCAGYTTVNRQVSWQPYN